MKEKLVYKNKKGKIICITDNWGSNKYILLDEKSMFVKELFIPFKVSDYL